MQALSYGQVTGESAWWGKAALIALENGQLVARELKLDSAS